LFEPVGWCGVAFIDMSHNFHMHLLGGLAATSVFWLGSCAEPEVAADIEEVREIELIVMVQGPEDIEEALHLNAEDLSLEEADDPDMIVTHCDCWTHPPEDYDLFAGTESSPPMMKAKSVRAGLDWLKKHQSPAGYWDADRFMEQDGRKDLAASDGPGNLLNDVGLTGLALLAISGDGYTSMGDPRMDSFRKAILWLMENQSDQGLFGQDAGNATLYNHAIASLAVSEACVLSHRSPRLKISVEKAVEPILRARNPYGAWRYSLTPNGDNDTSVTGWMVAALTSAKDSGIKVDNAVFDGAKAWFDSMRDKNTGRVGYAWGEGGGGPGSYPVRNPMLIDAFPAERSESLTAVALLAQIFMTDRAKIKRWEDHPDYEMMKKQVDLILAKPPVWNEKNGSIDLYYWYFGTLAMCQWGGEECMAWVDSAAKAVLENQRLENAHDNFYGSWDPVGPWGEEGGRIYSTALCTLILEVHFRHAKLISNE
jgi:hypothetical protein